MRGQTKFTTISQNIHATKDLEANNKFMRQYPKMCWQCQKESPFEHGAYLQINKGLQKYICKACMNAKHGKEANAQK